MRSVSHSSFPRRRSTVVPLALAALTVAIAATGRVVAAEPTQVDVFTAGREGYHTFRIPALLVTPGGTLLAICEGRKTSRSDHGDLDLVLKRSSDGGQTWGPLELIYEEGGEKKITIGNPCPVYDKETDVIWLPFTRDNDDVFVTSSSDEGKTWTRPRNITADVKKDDWNWYATGPGNGIQLTQGKYAGRLVIPCDHRVDGATNDWGHAGRSHVIYSDDHGKTWKLGGATGFAMNECAVVELPDGALKLNMRSYRGKGRRGVAISRDGGQTWSEPVEDETLVEPVCQASFIRYSWADDGRNRVLFSNPASTKGRHHLTVRLSYDNGRTWPVSRLLYEPSSAYSSLAVLPFGKIGILYERDDYKKITFSQFDLEWLTRGKDKADGR